MKHISVDIKILDHRLQDNLPGYATTGSAGIDLRACIDHNMVIQPKQCELIPSGIAIHLMLSAVSADWAALGGTGEVLGFFIFWVANVTIVIRGAESIKHLEALAAPLLLAVAVGLIFWALPKVSLTEVLATPATRPEGTPFAGTTVRAPRAVWDLDGKTIGLPDGCRVERKGGWTGELSPTTLDLAVSILRVPGPARIEGPGVSVQGVNLAWEWVEGKITMQSTMSRLSPAKGPGRKG